MNEHATAIDYDLILASASPRRAEILQQLGVSFSVIPAEIDESPKIKETPSVYVRRLALYKVEAVSAGAPTFCSRLGGRYGGRR